MSSGNSRNEGYVAGGGNMCLVREARSDVVLLQLGFYKVQEAGGRRQDNFNIRRFNAAQQDVIFRG